MTLDPVLLTAYLVVAALIGFYEYCIYDPYGERRELAQIRKERLAQLRAESKQTAIRIAALREETR